MCAQIHHGMSFANLCGDSVLADARLLALDGFIFPFHRLIFHVAPEDRQLKNCDFQSYINSQYQDGQVLSLSVFVLGRNTDCS